ncbi:MAG: class I SAM-dependent methyltransferase [Phycisphaerales bacterium]
MTGSSRREEDESASSTATAFYDHPEWYDILHAEGTAKEVDGLERMNTRFGRGGRRWLEPACGTGRFLLLLARRGYLPTGYDINPHCLRYAKDRLKRAGLRASVVEADMASFERPDAFDFAFNTINTFRHLLDEAEVDAHLERTASSLKAGGLYVVGVDLADYELGFHEEERWTARRGSIEITHLMMAEPPNRRTRRERIINHITVTTPTRERYFESVYDLRSYDFDEWLALIDRSPFEIAATCDFQWREIDLSPEHRDFNFVLRKR